MASSSGTSRPKRPRGVTPPPSRLRVTEDGRRRRRRNSSRHRHRHLDARTASRLEVLCVALQALVAGGSLLTAVPMAVVASAWGRRGRRGEGGLCPLFVGAPPGLSAAPWGSEDLTPCSAAAFLPVVTAVLASATALYHCGSLRQLRRQEEEEDDDDDDEGRSRPAAPSRLQGLAVLSTGLLEALLCLCAALTLTEGLRKTCIAFDLGLSWGGEASRASCGESYARRDEAQGLAAFGTFPKVLAALVGAWASALAAAVLSVAYAVRAGLCRCQLLCL